MDDTTCEAVQLALSLAFSAADGHSADSNRRSAGPPAPAPASAPASAPATVLTIAHRVSTLMAMPRVLLLQDGRLVGGRCRDELAWSE